MALILKDLVYCAVLRDPAKDRRVVLFGENHSFGGVCQCDPPVHVGDDLCTSTVELMHTVSAANLSISDVFWEAPYLLTTRGATPPVTTALLGFQGNPSQNELHGFYSRNPQLFLQDERYAGAMPMRIHNCDLRSAEDLSEVGANFTDPLAVETWPPLPLLHPPHTEDERMDTELVDIQAAEWFLELGGSEGVRVATRELWQTIFDVAAKHHGAASDVIRGAFDTATARLPYVVHWETDDTHLPPYWKISKQLAHIATEERGALLRYTMNTMEQWGQALVPPPANPDQFDSVDNADVVGLAVLFSGGDKEELETYMRRQEDLRKAVADARRQEAHFRQLAFLSNTARDALHAAGHKTLADVEFLGPSVDVAREMDLVMREPVHFLSSSADQLFMDIYLTARFLRFGQDLSYIYTGAAHSRTIGAILVEYMNFERLYNQTKHNYADNYRFGRFPQGPARCLRVVDEDAQDLLLLPPKPDLHSHKKRKSATSSYGPRTLTPVKWGR